MNRAQTTVLLIADKPAKGASLRNLLADIPAEVTEARSLDEARSLAQDVEFALVLLDARQPKSDAPATVARLRREPRLRLTPIVVIAARAQLEQLRRQFARRDPKGDVVVSTTNDAALPASLHLLLEVHHSRQALASARAQLEERDAQLQAEGIQRRKAEEMINHQALHDVLTGLPNRLLYMDRLETAVQRSALEGRSFALAYVDLDDFKDVNDRYGHQAGDELLRQVAARLRATCRRSDIVARLGGDEFGVVLDRVGSTDNVMRLLERLRQAIARTYRLSFAGHEGVIEVAAGASIGASVFPLHARTVDDLIRAADMAMYRVKASGKNRCQMCQDS